MRGPSIDLEGLLGRLRDEDYYSLPFQFIPRGRGADLVELKARIDEAIDRANEAAMSRVPEDPTWCTPADVGLKALMAEVSEGSMNEAEVSAWLTDLIDGLGDLPVRITPQPKSNRVPWRTLDSWDDGSRYAPTSFLFFTAPASSTPNGVVHRSLPPEVISEVADGLEEWGRFPSGGVAVSRGLETYACHSGRGAAELRKIFDEQLMLRQYTLHPRRLSMASFSFQATAVLQYFDETMPALDMLNRILDALRHLGHLLDYAYVRLDRLGNPSDQVSDWSHGRGMTESEARFRHSAIWSANYLMSPNVAQVLNPRHIGKGPDLNGFTTEDLGNGRLLAVAREPERWLIDRNPPPDLVETATTALGPALLNATRSTPLTPHLE